MSPKELWCVLNFGSHVILSVNADRLLADKSRERIMGEEPSKASVLRILTFDDAILQIEKWAEAEALQYYNGY